MYTIFNEKKNTQDIKKYHIHFIFLLRLIFIIETPTSTAGKTAIMKFDEKPLHGLDKEKIH